MQHSQRLSNNPYPLWGKQLWNWEIIGEGRKITDIVNWFYEKNVVVKTETLVFKSLVQIVIISQLNICNSGLVLSFYTILLLIGLRPTKSIAFDFIIDIFFSILLCYIRWIFLFENYFQKSQSIFNHLLIKIYSFSSSSLPSLVAFRHRAIYPFSLLSSKMWNFSECNNISISFMSPIAYIVPIPFSVSSASLSSPHLGPASNCHYLFSLIR